MGQPSSGHKKIEVRLGRKTYDIIATIADVENDILGWDFMYKHKLSMEWDDSEGLILHDKKANIKAKLKCVALPVGSAPRTAVVSDPYSIYSSTTELFEVAAMKSLPTPNTSSQPIQAKYLRCPLVLLLSQ